VPAAVVPDGLAALWFVPPAAGYLALLVAESRTRVARWGRAVGATTRHALGEPETDSLARNGRRVGALAIAAALLVPAVLPLVEDGLLGRGGSGAGQGRTIRTDNPIVDLHRDLVRPDNVELLTYQTDAPAPPYIRIVTLDTFDGATWRTSDRRVPESQRVEEGMPAPPGLENPPAEVDTYDIEVSENYASRWLPMPYPAAEVTIDGDWRYVVETLDVVSPDDDVRAQSYTVLRYRVEPSVAALQASGPVPEDLQGQLALPEDLPSLVTELAGEVTAEADDAFGRAAALQAFFRSAGGFEYDVQTVPGHSSTALVDFLQERRGYCEQFAASMAVMARALGIPARVAVGFLPGEARGVSDTYRVHAHDAHAWPELWFTGVGWVPFEPTPGQRTGGAPSWTVPPVERDAGDATQAPAPGGPGGAVPPTNPRMADRQLLEGEETSAQGVAPGTPWWSLGLGGLAVMAVLAMPAAVAWLRRGLRWRRAGAEPARQAEAAWADLRDAARDAGLPWDPATTPRSAGHDVAERAELDEDSRDLLTHVVGAAERARYARVAPPVEGLRGDSDLLRRTVLRRTSRRRRLQAWMWPAATRDVVAVSAERVADGLDWVDSTGERVRMRAGALLRRRTV
jgi:transglutaminase-like putative cysteine protease